MAFAGYLATFFEDASWIAAEASGTTSPSFAPSAILVGMATLPAIFVVLGVYALIDANEEALRYEIGVYCSQGMDGDSVVDVWSALYGWIPVGAYLAGLLAYLAFTPGVVANLQNGLPDIISWPLLHHRDGHPCLDTDQAERRPGDLAGRGGQVVGRQASLHHRTARPVRPSIP